MTTAKFYDVVRLAAPGRKLAQSQIDGIDLGLAEARRRRVALPFVAYILATAAHETAWTFESIVERGGREYFNKYDGREDLENNRPGDGYLFRGRSYSQLTGRRNYTLFTSRLGVDLVGDPDLALDPKIGLAVLFEGMLDGLFTGVSLRRYITADGPRDYFNARRVVNGTDRAAEIEALAYEFEAALEDVNLLADSETMKTAREQTAAATLGAGGLTGAVLFEPIAKAIVGESTTIVEAGAVGQALGVMMPFAATVLTVASIVAFLYLRKRAAKVAAERVKIHKTKGA